jgi:tetratricopeptide (TPR) repeat protein
VIKWLAKWFGHKTKADKTSDTKPSEAVPQVPVAPEAAPPPQAAQTPTPRETLAVLPAAPATPGTPTAPTPAAIPSPPAPTRTRTTHGWLSRPIFITSTFRDLQAERDWLGQRVFPELQERLRGRRVVIEPIDLRLGVDTAAIADEGQRELQVLQVSLAEIARSRPFLIGLIGERYGWIPPAERMRAAADEAGFAGEIAGRSVTELEIAYGVLASPAQQRRSFFYLREPLPCSEMDPAVAADYAETFATDADATERAERAQKLLALKARLAEELPDRLRPYHATWTGQTVSGLEAFGEQVLEDLWRELDLETRDRIGAPAPTWQESERDTLQEFLDWRASGFIGRTAELDRLERLCLDPAPDASALCLSGEAGAGKSALLAALAQRLAAAPGGPTGKAAPLLLVHAAGVSPLAGQADAMVRRWVGELAQALGIPEPIDERTATDDLRSAFHDLLRRTAAKRRVVLLIDALNQFVSGSPLSWLPTRLPENLRLIASTLPGRESEAAKAAGFACEALPPIDEAAARRIVETLCDRYHRKLNERVLQALLGRRLPDGRPACGNPLWLTLAVDELNLLDAADFARAERAEPDPTLFPAERLTRFLIDIAKDLPVTVGPAYQKLLRRAEAVHGEARCRAFAASLALARAGLREADFAGLWRTLTGEPWQPLAFAALRRSFRAHVVARGASGQWDFTHAQMRQAALAHYLPKESQQREQHARLAAHFGGLAADDPLHQSETMVHLIGADDQAGAAALYGGELTDGELAGVTAALAEHVLQTGEAGADWVAGLSEQPLAPEEMGRLGQRFNFHLDDALEARAPLAPRRRLLEASRGSFERLTTADPGNAGWQDQLSASYMRIGYLLKAQGDLAAAGAAYRASLAIQERLTAAGPNHAGWQRNLAVSHEMIGTVLQTQGDLAAAGEAYRASHAIFERLTAADRGNAGRQRDLAASHSKIGNLFWAQGNFAGASVAYRASRAICERLTTADPTNANWQQDLSVSHDKIGHLLQMQGDLAAAGVAYRASLAIREHLAAADPSNTKWQRDLSVSHINIGDLLTAQGDLAGAGAAFRASLAIGERLAAADPGNAGWQLDLSGSHKKIGDLLMAQGDLAGAGAAFRTSLAVRERLTATDPTNANWQQDLADSNDRLGDVLQAMGRLAGALGWYRASSDIRELLAGAEPANSLLLRTLAASKNRIGAILQAQGDLAGALQAFRAGLEIAERLACAEPCSAEWQRDRSVLRNRIGDILRAQGDLVGAFQECQSAVEIIERIARANPSNAQWQRDISVTHDNLGDILQAKGDLEGALAAYRTGMEIHQRLARAEPTNALWQRDLVVSHTKLYNVAAATDDAALGRYHLAQCLRVLHSMQRAGLHLDTGLRVLIAQLELADIREDEANPLSESP